jgi:hypothetical protein
MTSEPTRIVLGREQPQHLPAPAGPPPPPIPPAPPAVADRDPDWWRNRSGPPGPLAPAPVDVHVIVTVDVAGDPDPEPPWWARIRWGYHLLMISIAFPVSGPWAWVLNDVRDEKGLAAAWVMAAVVWAVIAVWDNVCRIRALQAHPEAWLPKIRATVARVLLYAAITATALTLPLTTATFWITGVQSP